MEGTKMHKPSEFIKNGYTVTPAQNGGWVVRKSAPEGYVADVVAFSSSSDLLLYLRGAHADGDKVA